MAGLDGFSKVNTDIENLRNVVAELFVNWDCEVVLRIVEVF